MLRLITGRIRSGKSAYLYQKLDEAVSSGNRTVLLVPEQSSFVTEKTILELLGPEKADSVSIYSFSFMAKEVLKKYRPDTRPVLDDSIRAVLMSTVLNELSGMLSLYGRKKNNPSMITRMIETVKDMRRNSVSGDQLRKIRAQIKENDILSEKINEIATVADVYGAFVEGSYFDDTTALDVLDEVLQSCSEFENTYIFVDGFAGFTPQEMKVLGRLMLSAPEVYVALPCAQGSENGATEYVRRTLRELKNLANRKGVQIAPVVSLSPDYSNSYASKEFSYLERGLYESVFERYPSKTQAVTLAFAESCYDECAYVAHTIKKLVCEENYRCRDIAVISRSEDEYLKTVVSFLKTDGLPCFEDKRRPIVSTPLIQLVLGALDIASYGYDCERVMMMLKTGLTGLENDDVSELENYCLTWKITGNKWLSDWTGHPDGLGQEFNEKSRETLERINRSRTAVTDAVEPFRRALKSCDGLKGAKAVYFLLRDLNAGENLKKVSYELVQNGDSEGAAFNAALWKTLIEILDKISALPETMQLSDKEFRNLFGLIVSMYSIGDVPQRPDEISVGAADRVALQNPKVVFVIGVNGGRFPLVSGSGGLLTEQERRILAGHDIKMGDGPEDRIIQERFIAYKTFTCAGEKLYVTSCKRDLKGAEISSSEIIEDITGIFPNVNRVNISELDEDYSVRGDVPAFELMAKLSHKKSPLYFALRDYFAGREDFVTRLEALERSQNRTPFEIKNSAVARELFGNDMHLSASKTETYAECPFRYFCNYGLGAKPRKLAEIDPMNKGTAIHYILEQLLKKYPGHSVCDITKEQRDAEIGEILTAYIDEKLLHGVDMGKRFEFLFGQLEGVICDVVDRLAAEFEVSEFYPVAFETSIKNGGDIVPMTVSLPDGGSISVEGVVDRIDVAQTENDTYLRIIDYKSGGKNFNIGEVFDGLNMQMLIYLFTIWKSGMPGYGDIVPAGILYMPAKAPYVDGNPENAEEVAKEKLKKCKMSGIVLDDTRAVYLMDSRCGKEFVPAGIKDGAVTGDAISLKKMELLMKRMEKILSDMAMAMHGGVIPAKPVSTTRSGSCYKDVCAYCDYKTVCHICEDDDRKVLENLSNKESIEMLGEEGEEDAEVD